MLAGPRLLCYVEKAELARIQHNVKVMENKMAEILNTNNNFDEWQNNGKDLGRVVMRKELFEKQGVAKNIDWEHLSAKWLRVNNWDRETTGISWSNRGVGATGKSTEEMKNKETYKGWNFKDIWQINEDSYPTLR